MSQLEEIKNQDSYQPRVLTESELKIFNDTKLLEPQEGDKETNFNEHGGSKSDWVWTKVKGEQDLRLMPPKTV